MPLEEAWAVLTDLERIAPCLPGAELTEVNGDEHRGVVKVKVGPITAQYKGTATFKERDEAAGKVVLKATGRDMIINTGAWTNMSVEHTARTGADKGYFMIVPEDCCSTMNSDWHNASINFAMQNVAVVTRADTVIRALG